MALDASACLVVFSGGQDSATCLAWALKNYERVETVGFDYGQRHKVELDQRPKLIAEHVIGEDDTERYEVKIEHLKPPGKGYSWPGIPSPPL